MERSSKGFGLISILLLLAVVASIIGTTALAMQRRLGASKSRDTAIQGQYAARAGLNRALIELRDDELWSPGTFTGDLGTSQIAFRVEVLNNRGVGAVVVTAPDNTTVAPGFVWLRATGVINGKDVQGSSGQSTTLATKPLPLFDYATENYNYGEVHGFTDSFDSSLGPFPSGTGIQGHVRSHRLLQVMDPAVVNGDVVPSKTNETIPAVGNPGISAQNPTMVTNAATLNGTVRTDTTPSANVVYTLSPALAGMPLVPPPSGLIPPGSYSWDNSNRDYLFDEGEYYFDRFSLRGGQQISKVGAGPTTVYIGLSANIDGMVNVGGRPEDFRMFAVGPPSVPSYKPMTFNTGTSDVQAFMLCDGFDQAWVASNPGQSFEIFGAVAGHSVTIFPGCSVHYDESLAGRPLPASTAWILVNEAEQ